jgi:hypothetical protein
MVLYTGAGHAQVKTNLHKKEKLYDRVDSLLVLDPRTWISIKNGQNEFVHCHDLSESVHDSILMAVQDYFSDTLVWYGNRDSRKSPIGTDFTYFDETKERAVTDSIFHFISALKQCPSHIKKIKAPEFFKGIISESGHRYGMLIFQYGSIKSDDLYKRQIAGSIIFGLLTRGAWPEITEYHSELTICIIDSKADEVILFGQNGMKINPLLRSTFKQHMHLMLDFKLRHYRSSR